MNHPGQKSYPLDCSAIIHVAANNKRTTNSYRLILTMKDPVIPELLQEALDAICPRYPTIVAGIRPGWFRYYVEPLERRVLVKEDDGLLLGMDAEEILRGGIRVIHKGNQICVETFHGLTDGYGAWNFIKSLAGEYLNRAYGIDAGCAGDLITPATSPDDEEAEDAFLRYAGKEKSKMVHAPVFQLPPRGEDTRIQNVAMTLPVQPVLDMARAHKGTITTLMTVLMAVSLMEVQKQRTGKLMPVSVMVPMDLRKRFPSRSLRNFSLYTLPRLEPGEEMLPLDTLMEKTHLQLERQLSKEHLHTMVTTTASMEKNFLLSRVPLAVKALGIRLGYHFFGSGNSSISLSNLGQLAMPEAMRPFVLQADCLLTPRINGTYNCGIISYGGKIRINFTRNCPQPELERVFVRTLRKLGLCPTIEVDGRETEEL